MVQVDAELVWRFQDSDHVANLCPTRRPCGHLIDAGRVRTTAQRRRTPVRREPTRNSAPKTTALGRPGGNRRHTTPVPARRQGKNAPQPARDWTLRKRPLCPQEAGGQDPRGRRPGMAKGNHLTDHSAESQPAPAPKTYRAPGQRRQGSQHSIQPRQGRPRTTWETGNNGQKLPGCTGATRPGRPGTNSSFLAKTRGPQAHLCRENRAQNQRHTSEYKSYLFPRTGTPRAPPGFARENQDIHLCRAPVAKLRSSRVNRKTYVGPPLLL